VQLNPPASPPLILPFLKGVPGFSRGRDLIRKGGIKVKCKEPLFRLRSDEMDNGVIHFESSLVVIMNKGNSHMFLNLCRALVIPFWARHDLGLYLVWSRY